MKGQEKKRLFTAGLICVTHLCSADRRIMDGFVLKKRKRLSLGGLRKKFQFLPGCLAPCKTHYLTDFTGIKYHIFTF